jgi:predicted AAA+ superfamily ATPase
LTLLQRDLRDLANIEGLTDLPRLLKMLAARAGSLLNFAEISRSIGLPQTTLKRYVALLENIFLFEMLPAWSGNLSKRLTRTPKLFFSDTGLLAHLQNLTWSKIQYDSTFAGFLTENFVYTELRKQIGWSNSKVQMFHFRTLNDQEIDFVLELPNGEIIGIEVKSAESITEKSFKTLRLLQSEMPTKFKRGFVMYSGNQTVPFGDNLFAVPISSLWRT